MKDGVYWYVDLNHKKLEPELYRLTVKDGHAYWSNLFADVNHEHWWPLEGSWPLRHKGHTNYWNAWAELCRKKQAHKKEPQS